MTAHIYVKAWTYDGFTWDNCWEIPFTEYSIDESDYRNKTAKFKSDRIMDTSTTSWAVKITNPNHETFTGIILKRDKKPDNISEYSCQDWNRLYMAKPTMDAKGKVHTLLKILLNYCGRSQFVWKGLLAKNKYEQKKYGSIISFNPMKNVKTISVKDKTVKEIIQNLVYSQKPFIDIHYNNTGVMQFTPYHIDTWMKSVADFHYTECVDFSYSFDTTNIITKVVFSNQIYNFSKLFNTKTDPLGNIISTQVSLNENVTSNNTNQDKSNGKKSKTNDKTSNPYKTKHKEVWVNMDECWGHSTDTKYLNAFCKELKRLGWKVHNLGVKPSMHTNSKYASKCKKGIWLTLDNGVDCEVFRHFGHDNWFKSILLRNKSRAVIGFINNAGNIKKGGKYYKYLGMAHDGTGKGNPGLRYPAGYLADCGVPFFYSKGRHPKTAARLFNKGGDSKIALNNSYKKRLGGYYKNWNWSNKY
jgi:hypothetical protein